MSKLEGQMKWKDWCILKHSLEKMLEQRELTLFIDTVTSTNNLSVEERKTLVKEMAEEKKTLETLTKITDSFKLYISGKKNYYSPEGIIEEKRGYE